MHTKSTEHRDVIIVGVGISGICAAWHIGRDCPDLSYAVIEARQDLGRGPLLNLDAGYITRAAQDLPQGGDRAPWKVRQNYVLDVMDVDRKPVVDEAMQFGKAALGQEVA